MHFLLDLKGVGSTACQWRGERRQKFLGGVRNLMFYPKIKVWKLLSCLISVFKSEPLYSTKTHTMNFQYSSEINPSDQLSVNFYAQGQGNNSGTLFTGVRQFIDEGECQRAMMAWNAGRINSKVGCCGLTLEVELDRTWKFFLRYQKKKSLPWGFSAIIKLDGSCQKNKKDFFLSCQAQ